MYSEVNSLDSDSLIEQHAPLVKRITHYLMGCSIKRWSPIQSSAAFDWDVRQCRRRVG